MSEIKALNGNTSGKRFSVALSFPGEHRKFVSAVAGHLARRLATGKVFYDEWFEHELARPNLDTFLQSIYREDSRLVVVFLCTAYEGKEWCGLEWRAIRDLIKSRRDDEIMFVRLDEGPVAGTFSVDGFLDARKKSSDEVGDLILKRLGLLAERDLPAKSEQLSISKSRKKISFTHSFDEVFGLLTKVDELLLKTFHGLRLSDYEAVHRAYGLLLGSTLAANELDVVRFLHQIHNTNYLAALQSSALASEKLVITVGERFEKVEFFDAQKLLLPISRPKLLWDCCCRDHPKGIGKQFCRLHSHPTGNHVAKLFTSQLVRIKWKDTDYFWKRSAELWPPSVDAFFMLDCLEKDGVFSRPHRTVLDIGSGTGFLGTVIAAENPAVRHLYLSDWLLTPVLMGQLNAFCNLSKRNHVEIHSMLGMHTDWRSISQRAPEPFDLVVCNPPYLPIEPGFEQIALESTVAGTDLLEHVILNGRRLGLRVYVQFSKLAEQEAHRAAKVAGVRLKVIGTRKNVPFRVTHAFDHPAYLHALMKKRGLVKKKVKGHHYYHSLMTCEVL